MSNKNEPPSRDRREVIRVGGAAAFGAIAAWLMAGVSAVRAEAPRLRRLLRLTDDA